MSEGGRTPALSLDELRDLRYGVVLYPITMMRIAAKQFGEFLTNLKLEGSSASWLDRMHGLDGLNAIVELDDYLEVDERFKDYSLKK